MFVCYGSTNYLNVYLNHFNFKRRHQKCKAKRIFQKDQINRLDYLYLVIKTAWLAICLASGHYQKSSADF